MNPQLFTQPLSDYNLDNLANKDGLLAVIPLLDLDLDDKFIIQNLNLAINQSMDYFDDVNEYNLKNKRLKNAQMLEGKHLQEHKLYRHQTPYMDNEMFVGVDAIMSYACAQVPRAEVYPNEDTDESKQAATDLEAYLHSHSEKFELNRKVEGALYNLMGKYVGFLKLRWDPNYGQFGEIITEVVDSNHIIIDKNARMGENPRFICHVLKDSIEGLISRFPDKEKEILRVFNIQRKAKKNTSSEIAYREVWFTYYDKQHKPQEAVAWYVLDLVLAKYRNPNWLYGDEGENFLDMPMKPFIPFNGINDGTSWIDKTSAVEQAVAQQEVLNKLGRQVIDNLATANGFKVLDAAAMRSEDAQNFTGDPNQLLLVKTKPNQTVKDVVAQLPPQLVSEQAVNMLAQNSATIHNILGTPIQFRGGTDADSNNDMTATEANMIKNQASGRQDKLVRAVEYGLDMYFRLLTQFISVWYTEKHMATINGGDGNFDYIEMHKDKVKHGMNVRVQSGTTLPFDKARQEAVAQNAAKLGLLAPYDYYRLMHMDDPQKMYDNLVKWKTDPVSLAMDLAENDANRQAIVDFTELIAGKKVEQRHNPTADYLEQMRKLMIDDDFLKAPEKIQKAVIDYVRGAAQSLAIRNALEQASTQEKQETAPLPPAIQQSEFPGQISTMPQGMPGANVPMGPPGVPQGVPGGIPAIPGQPPVGPALGPPQGPLPGTPPVGPATPIQSIMQASAPALNPQQPQTQPTVGNLPPF